MLICISGRSFDRPSYNLLVGTSPGNSSIASSQGDLLIRPVSDRMGRDYTEIKESGNDQSKILKVDVYFWTCCYLIQARFSVEFEKRLEEKLS